MALIDRINIIGGIIAGILMILVGARITHYPILYDPVIGAPYFLIGFNIPFGTAWMIIGAVLFRVSISIKSIKRNVES